MIFLGLFIILAVVLIAPFSIKMIEEELEIFLFVMGCVAVTITSQWSLLLIEEALIEPLKITGAVLIAGFLFKGLQRSIAHNVNKFSKFLGIKMFVFLVIVVLGLLSSIITAIIAALILVEVVSHLKLKREKKIALTILACFSIGLGASLTPIGEPLSTIVVAKLKGAPYFAGFTFLFHHLLILVVPAVVLFGLIGAFFVSNQHHESRSMSGAGSENIKDIIFRSVKVYLFVMALIFLGQGFKPIVETYIVKISYQGLYWINIFSAVLDNATLAAAEVTPSMSILQIKSALLGLLIAGGMLIPGNIPNIICAGKLKIKSAEWAKLGVPLGLIFMAAYFLLIIFVR